MQDLKTIKGIGPIILKKLNKAGMHYDIDLLLHLPKDYEDRRAITPIDQLQSGTKQQIEGIIRHIETSRFGKKHLTCLIADDSGICKMHLFRYYPNQLKMLKIGATIRCYGEAGGSHHNEMVHPQWQIITKEPTTTGIMPIYSSIDGISSHILHKYISQLIKDINIDELLPQEIRKKHALNTISQALFNLHCPPPDALDTHNQVLYKARYRLALEEILSHHLNAKKVKMHILHEQAPKIRFNREFHRRFIAQLPFAPTTAQTRVIDEIFNDFKLTKPASRLVQGDVGSGKTVVATSALIQCACNDLQSVLMAPTEILAAQHYHNLKIWLDKLNIPVVLMVSKLPARQKKIIKETIASNRNCVIIGTHAVFQEQMEYGDIGLIVIDEQHRFGVEQRLALIKKGISTQGTPHQLIMTATPIPRTLAMTVYGDLDLSIIDELPPNRKPVTTSVLNELMKPQIIEKLKDHIKKGGQAYWVCPLIESSENMAHLQDVSSLYEMINGKLAEAKIGLIHGKMKPDDKTEIMQQFKARKLDILVATTVIEVGVDVPNANIMIIDNAERLGLSQLHQLRGRVGRGSKESVCILLYTPPLSNMTKKRLNLMRNSQDGFYLAEEDLKLRGAGDIFGKNQTGDIRFKVADLSLHQALFSDVIAIAKDLMTDFPESIDPIINRWLKNAGEYSKA
ncbi:MAG: ATP-dependent DNA helicase RecG [Francisellaceae bacterium]